MSIFNIYILVILLAVKASITSITISRCMLSKKIMILGKIYTSQIRSGLKSKYHQHLLRQVDLLTEWLIAVGLFAWVRVCLHSTVYLGFSITPHPHTMHSEKPCIQIGGGLYLCCLTWLGVWVVSALTQAGTSHFAVRMKAKLLGCWQFSNALLTISPEDETSSPAIDTIDYERILEYLSTKILGICPSDTHWWVQKQ